MRPVGTPMDNTARATAIGMMAPMLWGMSVGITRGIAENFGVAGGFFALYVMATLGLTAVFGIPKLHGWDWRYLVFGVGTANISAMCFIFSLALSSGGHQTMEVGMVNYLWPCMTILFSIAFNGQKAKWWVGIGMLLAFFGVAMVLGGDKGIDIDVLSAHIAENPLSYGLAFLGALTWSLYSSMTRAWSRGKNPVVIIFAIDALLIGIIWALGIGPKPVPNPHGFGYVGVVMGALATGTGYACWTYGIARGHMTLMAIASYFTPVLSCLFGSIWIGAQLTTSFWTGVMILVCGSIVCWLATRVNTPRLGQLGRVLFKGQSATHAHKA